MAEMTSQERFKRMFEHRPADRVPIIDGPWPATIERWRKEGMPAGADWAEYFGVDRSTSMSVDTSPRYPVEVLAETDESKTWTTSWGVTVREWTHAGGTPEFISHTIVDRGSWAAARERMTPDRDRVPWGHLKANYPTWRKRGYWIEAGLWFGFDVTHSWVVGTQRLLMALIDDPEWCVDMFNTFLDLNTALLDMVWEAGYEFDCVVWPDDLGYKQHQFMSLDMYRRLVKPVHRRACEWAHARGARVMLHSCGDVRPFVPEFVEIGVDCLNPLEVKAGMDPVALKAQFGDRLVFRGGINAVLWDHPEAIEAEMRRVVPAMKQGGGYIFSSDHSVPSSVSLTDFRRIVELAKELGAY